MLHLRLTTSRELQEEEEMHMKLLQLVEEACYQSQRRVAEESVVAMMIMVGDDANAVI